MRAVQFVAAQQGCLLAGRQKAPPTFAESTMRRTLKVFLTPSGQFAKFPLERRPEVEVQSNDRLVAGVASFRRVDDVEAAQ